MNIVVRGLATEAADHIRAGGTDANGQPAVRQPADGSPSPCRHCLGLIAAGEELLIFAHRPFPGIHPYAEVGPVFLHAESCSRYVDAHMPDWAMAMDQVVIRGYDQRDWIRYDTGDVVSGADLSASCRAILEDESVAYVHVRSKFNCFQWRVERAGELDGALSS